MSNFAASICKVMNEGQYIFRQVAQYLQRYQFDKLVKKYKGDYRSHELTCYNQFLHLLFGQLTACDSLRDVCLCLAAHKDKLYHLGFRNTVNLRRYHVLMSDEIIVYMKNLDNIYSPSSVQCMPRQLSQVST